MPKTDFQLINKSGKKFVLAITGGGTEAIHRWTSAGGASAALLEAIVPYNQNSFRNFVGGTPDKFCSADAARNLAMAAFQRALVVLPDHERGPQFETNLVGVGATCSLAKEGERAGRGHWVYVAVQTHNETRAFKLKLNYPYSRGAEEELAADLIIEAIKYGARLPDEVVGGPTDEQIQEGMQYLDQHMQGLFLGHRNRHRIILNEDHCSTPYLILPGSFRPLHKRHRDMAEAACLYLGASSANYELSIRNVDKPILDYWDVQQRLEDLQASDRTYIDSVYLTNAPRFTDKVKMFHGCTFLVGYDTMKRIADPKYYKDFIEYDQMISDMVKTNPTFLVFHRVVNGVVSTTEELFKGMPTKLAGLCQVFPNDLMEPIEMSSSAIRKQKEHA
jgi:hypothetical protein